MIASHPVVIETWEHRKLPAHTLCLSHVKDARGKRRCLAVPLAEAPKYLADLDRFAAMIASLARHHSTLEAARLAAAIHHPASKIPKRVHNPIPVSKLHRHQLGSPCLVPIEVPGEADWYACHPTRTLGATYVDPVNGYVHVHRTKRGRRFLVRHVQGDAYCPTTIARKAAEAAARESEPVA